MPDTNETIVPITPENLAAVVAAMPASAPHTPKFVAALHYITNRGRAPIPFLTELLSWGKKALAASPEIFAQNDNPKDAYAAILPYLGTFKGKDGNGKSIYVWDSITHRAAAMLELMRVHAGRESSWNWRDGVDTTNARSMTNTTAQETGIFDVSFDSEYLDSPDGKHIMEAFDQSHGLGTPEKFIPAMKLDHALAMEYYVRLVRVSIAWAGPLIESGEESVYPYLYRDSMSEFQTNLLAA